jgi:hypothetical protein
MNKLKNILKTTYVLMGYGWKLRFRYSGVKKKFFFNLSRMAA